MTTQTNKAHTEEEAHDHTNQQVTYRGKDTRPHKPTRHIQRKRDMTTQTNKAHTEEEAHDHTNQQGTYRGRGT